MNDGPNILIVKLSAIGDVVHTLPALNALRRHYPGAHITWLVEEAAAELVTGHPALNEVLVSGRKRWIKGLGTPRRRQHVNEIKAFMRNLRSRHFDMIFDFQASLKGAVLIALARGKRKIGFSRGLEHQEHSYIALNERIPAVSMEIHALERGLLMLQAVGIPRTHPIEYRLPVAAEHRRHADRLLAGHGIASQDPFWVVNPMAKWETKLWGQRKFAQVADRVQSEFHMPIVFTGANEDREYIEAIRNQMRTVAINLAGRTGLLILAALLQRAGAMITTDTGPMHIAAAVQTPVVALFGPTAPWRTGPYGDKHQVVFSNAKCAPCFKRTCISSECMKGIQVEDVLSKLEVLYRQTAKA